MRLLSGVRPATLVLSIAPVAVGGLAAIGYLEETHHYAVNIVCMLGTDPCRLQDMAERRQLVLFFAAWLLCLAVGLFLQIAANFANDYSDGVRGADQGRASGTPAGPGAAGGKGSGADGAEEDPQGPPGEPGPAAPGATRDAGPRRLVASGVSPAKVLAAAIINAVVACEAGLVLTVMTRHWWYIAIGAACLAAAWFYVGGRHPYGYAGWGGVSVFVFFGLVATLGTQYSLVGVLTPLGLLGAISCGLAACTTLSVNNLRDRKADALAGKRTMAVRLGYGGARALAACEALLSVAALVAAALACHSAFGGCAALLVFSLAVLMIGDLQEDEDAVNFRAMFRHSTELAWAMIVGYAMCVIPL